MDKTIWWYLCSMSRWIDEGNAHRDSEAITWGRLAKVSEESGEVIAAYIGMTGQNPRKGVVNSADDVRKELLDVAVTALAAHEHMTGNMGMTRVAFEEHMKYLYDRMIASRINGS